MIAGLVMLGFTLAYSGITGAGFWTPLRLISASMGDVPTLIATGEADGAASTATILLSGFVIHLTFAALWGILFVRLFPAVSGVTALGVGLLYGLAVWVLMTWGVLASVNQTMYARVQLEAGAFFFEHLLYGALVPLAPRLARRWPDESPGDSILGLRAS
jgi:hypothetical protein